MRLMTLTPYEILINLWNDLLVLVCDYDVAGLPSMPGKLFYSALEEELIYAEPGLEGRLGAVPGLRGYYYPDGYCLFWLITF